MHGLEELLLVGERRGRWTALALAGGRGNGRDERKAENEEQKCDSWIS